MNTTTKTIPRADYPLFYHTWITTLGYKLKTCKAIGDNYICKLINPTIEAI